MRISCLSPPLRDPSCPRPQTGARQRDGPVRRPLRPAAPRPEGPVGGGCVYYVCCSSVRAGERTRAPAPHHLRCRAGLGSCDAPLGHHRYPTAAEPVGFRVAHCQGADDPAVVPTQRSSRPSGRPDPAVVPTQRSSEGRQTSSEVVPRPRRKSPNRAVSHPLARSRTRNWRDEGGGATRPAVPPRWSRGDSNPGPPPCKGGALPAKLRPRSPPAPAPAPTARPGGVGAPGLEPGTSALSGPRSNRLSYAPAAGAVAPSSTAAAPARGSPRVASRPMPKTERAQPARPWRQPWPGDSARPNSGPSVAKTRGATDLPVIRGAPARSCHRLATGRPRGSVPTDAGSPLGGLTRVSSLTTATP
jgi:hypothetical protein